MLLGLSNLIIGQTATTEVNWTKSDRENLYEDCLSYVTKYKSTTQDQRESIALCYLDNISSKYKKNDFQSKIEIELKRIKESVITECSKNLGIVLSTEVKEEAPVVVKKEEAPKEEQKKEVVYKKEQVVGRWKSDSNFTIEFYRDGKFTQSYLGKYQSPNGGTINNNTKTGDYFMDERGILTLVYNWSETKTILSKTTKPKQYSVTYEYKILSLSKEYFKFENRTIAEKAIQFNRIE